MGKGFDTRKTRDLDLLHTGFLPGRGCVITVNDQKYYNREIKFSASLFCFWGGAFF
jgi:hypothetical protein